MKDKNAVHWKFPGQVKVAVLLCPRNQEKKVVDSNFADYVELQPELQQLKIAKEQGYMDNKLFSWN